MSSESASRPFPADQWEEALARELERLKECQSAHNLSSCLQCPEILGCKIRESYVTAVYESMNKGQGGGFEF
ncbi:hypothetical protein [Nitratifractor salsuginis]|uniref:Uncharacterized protein n=1 Tax=Nitratifractor salsuginis (strain DSM 16511 / JCM 12458 / E9I37-1) TaxID=749222 RepID=E6WXU3_NITSE|nr:hypothetical protein [Nitratifractor salsuginis]ADV46350.1 hypothetical protein Nitsa_1094 [Nitratifractor salsuginis DSM 16511]